MLDQTSSRMLAETLWGRGNSLAERCNHPAAHWFSCEEHGGLILDIDGLSGDEREDIAGFGKAMAGYVLRSGEQAMRAGVGEPLYNARGWKRQDVTFMTFERDRDWAVPMVVLGIGRFKDMTDIFRIDEANRLFQRYFDPINPEVMARRALDAAIDAGDRDLIVAAVRTSCDQCKVWTADEMQYLVEGYEEAKGPDGVHRLSLCINAIALDAEGQASGKPEAVDEMLEI